MGRPTINGNERTAAKGKGKRSQNVWRIVLPRRSKMVCRQIAQAYFRFGMLILVCSSLPAGILAACCFQTEIAMATPLVVSCAAVLFIPALIVSLGHLRQYFLFHAGSTWCEYILTDHSLIQYDYLGGTWVRKSLPITEVLDWNIGAKASALDDESHLHKIPLAHGQGVSFLQATFSHPKKPVNLAVAYSSTVQSELLQLIQQLRSKTAVRPPILSIVKEDSNEISLLEADHEFGEIEIDQDVTRCEIRLTSNRNFSSVARLVTMASSINILALTFVTVAWIYQFEMLSESLLLATVVILVALAGLAYKLYRMGEPLVPHFVISIDSTHLSFDQVRFLRQDILKVQYFYTTDSKNFIIRFSDGQTHSIPVAENNENGEWIARRINEAMGKGWTDNELDWRSFSPQVRGNNEHFLRRIQKHGIELAREGEDYQLLVPRPSPLSHVVALLIPLAIAGVTFSTLFSSPNPSLTSSLLIASMVFTTIALFLLLHFLFTNKRTNISFNRQQLLVVEQIAFLNRRLLWNGTVDRIDVSRTYLSLSGHCLEIQSSDQRMRRLLLNSSLEVIGCVAALLNIIVLEPDDLPADG